MLLKTASATALDFAKRLLSFDPSERINIDEALRHEYFAEVWEEPRDMSEQQKIIPVLLW